MRYTITQIVSELGNAIAFRTDTMWTESGEVFM